MLYTWIIHFIVQQKDRPINRSKAQRHIHKGKTKEWKQQFSRYLLENMALSNTYVVHLDHHFIVQRQVDRAGLYPLIIARRYPFKTNIPTYGPAGRVTIFCPRAQHHKMRHVPAVVIARSASMCAAFQNSSRSSLSFEVSSLLSLTRSCLS
jgi:hypothetical protein